VWMGTRVELFAQIRRDARVEDLSIRELARRHQVGRATVRQALAGAQPPPRKTPVRVAPKLGPFKFAIDAMLVEDLSAPRKQRHTARRVHARLIEEYDAREVLYSSVRDFIGVRRAQIEIDTGHRRAEVFVPQEHAPGAEAEVDFGELYVMLAGVKTKCHMFTFRLSHSGKAVHRIYPTQGQEAFLEGHVEAFATIGGVTTRHIRYDNLSAAVASVIYGTGRRWVENERWQLFYSLTGFDPFYCHPGIEGAHEKGGVEGEVGRFRRNRLSVAGPDMRLPRRATSRSVTTNVGWLPSIPESSATVAIVCSSIITSRSWLSTSDEKSPEFVGVATLTRTCLDDIRSVFTRRRQTRARPRPCATAVGHRTAIAAT